MQKQTETNELLELNQAVLKIIEILNGRNLYENKIILEKVKEIIKGSSVLVYPSDQFLKTIN